MFEWDESKRLIALSKHGIDFLDAAEIFQTDHLVLPARADVESRAIAVGLVNGVAVAVVFTMRGDTIRIITARRARRDERERYEEAVARRDPGAEVGN